MKIKILAALAISGAMSMGMGSTAHASFADPGLPLRAIAVELGAHPCHTKGCVYKLIAHYVKKHKKELRGPRGYQGPRGWTGATGATGMPGCRAVRPPVAGADLAAFARVMTTIGVQVVWRAG